MSWDQQIPPPLSSFQQVPNLYSPRPNLFQFKPKQCNSKCEGSRAVGTPNYMAPEILPGVEGEYSPFMADWWAVGCIIYEMLVGSPAFAGMSKPEIFKKIKQAEPQWPPIGGEEGQLRGEVKELVEAFLVKDPKKRLGGSLEEIKKFSFFRGVDWEGLSGQKSPIEIDVIEREARTSKLRMETLLNQSKS